VDPPPGRWNKCRALADPKCKSVHPSKLFAFRLESLGPQQLWIHKQAVEENVRAARHHSFLSLFRFNTAVLR
jgi:hypothetical protein